MKVLCIGTMTQPSPSGCGTLATQARMKSGLCFAVPCVLLALTAHSVAGTSSLCRMYAMMYGTCVVIAKSNLSFVGKLLAWRLPPLHGIDLLSLTGHLVLRVLTRYMCSFTCVQMHRCSDMNCISIADGIATMRMPAMLRIVLLSAFAVSSLQAQPSWPPSAAQPPVLPTQFTSSLSMTVAGRDVGPGWIQFSDQLKVRPVSASQC